MIEQDELEVEKKSIPENEDLNQFEKIEQDELEVEKKSIPENEDLDKCRKD